jgi:lipid-A-disaccharide synthase
MAKKIFIIAGEASGDMHAAGLCKELKAREPDISITGVGGPAMKKAGVDLLFPNSRLAVVGLFEVLSHAGPIFSAYRTVTKWLKKYRPSVLILVDYPEFNLLVASRAKKLGIPVFYYISPQIWAWREGRVKKIRRLVDRMAVILPFEKEFYSRHGMDVAYVGHPLIDTVKPSTDRETFCAQHGMNPDWPVVGLLPGSRTGEIRRFFKTMLETGRLVKNAVPAAQFVIPAAPGMENATIDLLKKEIKETLPAWDRDNFRIVYDQTHDAIAASDIILTASGTVTLEAGIIGTPMVVMYTVSPITYHLGRHLIKVKYCSLVNLVAGREIVPEILQDEVTPQRLASEITSRLKDASELSRIRQELHSLRDMLGGGGAAGRAAEEVVALMGVKGAKGA